MRLRHGSVPALRRLLALDPEDLGPASAPRVPEASDDTPKAPPRLNEVVRSFAVGYNAALNRPPAELDFTELAHGLRGFAVEGAAMSSTLLDLMTLSRGRRLRALAAGPGQGYIHLIHVGAGWAYARLRLRPWRGVRCAHPTLRWLAWDGWGFHQAYFDPERVFDRCAVEGGARSDVRPIRDQGVGRALWFHGAADPERIAGKIAAFPAPRRPDLWAGIGLAAGYTGAQPPHVLDRLLNRAVGYHDHVAQGAAFAAKAHALSGEIPEEAANAVERLTGADPMEAADWTDAALIAVRNEPDTPRTYELWRTGVRGAWTQRTQLKGRATT